MPRGRPKRTTVDIIQNLASNVQKLTQKVAELEKKNEYTSENVLKISGYGQEASVTPPDLNVQNWQMPTSFLQTAQRILGEKFQFRCEPSLDMPQFIFTVIVPPEYSAIKNVPDERSKTISNALGVNGVEEWCNLVKQNVIKSLGSNVLQTL